MPKRVSEHGRRGNLPSSIPQLDEEVFRPHDLPELLGIADLDYRQLRKLYELARWQGGRSVAPGWAQMSVRDISAMGVAAELALTSVNTLPLTRPRMMLKPVVDACQALLGRGVIEPLLTVRMQRVGRRVLAVVDGTVMDPTTGQIALDIALASTQSLIGGESVAGFLPSHNLPRSKVTSLWQLTAAIGE